LLVEDHKINQVVIKNLLCTRGHIVEVAGNGKEALRLLDNRPFDVVLMDIMMPEMDGLETTRRIRQREENTDKHIPIIALTAHAAFGDREKFLAAGMDDYIAKPVQMDVLFSSVENALVNRADYQYNFLERLTFKDLFYQVDRNFIEQLEDYLVELDTAIQAANFDQIENYAHAIKELAYSIDEINIRNLAFKIELSSRKNDIDNINTLRDRLQDNFHSLKAMGS
jgi:CheY-like chemotaxis protein